MPCFTAMRAEIALMSGSAFAVTHHAFSSGAGRTSDGNGSHASTLKSPSYTKSVSWQHYPQRYAHCHPLNRSRLSFVFYTAQG
ncbi:putative IS1 encoded protein [Shigella flexneri SFJ17B]|nr:putative IS1 encoded protein [Shigella flexneri SFJ17B]